MKKGCIFLISARKKLLKTCLSYLNKNYNSKFNYPILIFYHGHKYDDENFRKSIKDINLNTEYSFHKVEAKIPKHLEEKDMFWNLPNNRYAKGFGKKREGYLHAIYWKTISFGLSVFENYDYVMQIDDESWFKNNIDYDLFCEVDNDKKYFGTGFTWYSQRNNIANNKDTRYKLFEFIKNIVEKNNITIKNKYLKEAVLNNDEEKFHTSLLWCTDIKVFNMKIIRTKEFSDFIEEFKKTDGAFKYRWGDVELICIYYYIFIDENFLDFKLKEKNLFEPKLPGSGIIHNGL